LYVNTPHLHSFPTRRSSDLDPAYEHHMTEALWVHQWHNVVDENLLRRMLKSPEANARAAATRVLCYWRDRIPEAISLLKTQAAEDRKSTRLNSSHVEISYAV